MRPTALIAGGGLAGIAAAIFLDELGYQVTLVEQRPILGGRTHSFQDRKTGLTIDNGQHLIAGAYHETIQLLEKIGAKHHIEMQIPTRVPIADQNFKKNIFKLSTLYPPLNLAWAFLQFGGLKIKDKFSLIKLSQELKKIKNEKIPLPRMESITQWLKKFSQSEDAMKNFWDVLTLATLNDAPNITTADGLAQVMIKSYFSGKAGGCLIFPKTGLSELFALPAEKYLNLRGQTIIKSCHLKEIRILNNQVQSCKLSDHTELKADLYISALPFQALIRALPEAFTASQVELTQIKKFQSSPIVSINLFYDHDRMTDDFIGSAATRTHWFFKKKIPNHELTDSRVKSHIVGVISGAYDLLELQKDEIVKIADSDLRKIYPKMRDAKLVHALVNKEREATLSSRVGINALRPKQKILNNFFVVGDWTQTNLPATIESAVLSSRMMIQALAPENGT